MTGSVNRQILLKSRPEGAPSLDNFELTETPTPEPGDGEVLMRTIYLSLDPYMRGRMNATKSYAAPVAIGQPMVGGTVGEIVKSRNPEYSVGDIVLGKGGWQEYALSDGAGLRKLDPKAAPVSTALGVLGMPGMTAYVGLLEIGQPKPGETVVVAAASGAVGSVVGQIAKIKGCHAVGIVGGTEKCRFVTGELGFDACVDHRARCRPVRRAGCLRRLAADVRGNLPSDPASAPFVRPSPYRRDCRSRPRRCARRARRNDCGRQ